VRFLYNTRYQYLFVYYKFGPLRCPLQRFCGKYYMENRPLCPVCKAKPVAVNYIKENVSHYRSCCDTCIRKRRKLKPQSPQWAKSGYKKKTQCEKCEFSAKQLDQLNVFHIDGNLKNNDWTNLKTICLNCTAEIYRSKLKWKPSPPVPDF